jgi:NitT/TauT family transport system ATP-binding protein
MLKLEEVSFSYPSKKENKIIDKMTFELEDASFVSLIGPSGCGKTTVANLIAGYLVPNRGTIKVGAKLVTKPGRERFIINQDDDLFEWMTVEQNVRFVARQGIHKYLKLVHLEGHEKKYPYQLSGGMKKRAAIARALAADAGYLIIDEAFSSLDFQMKEHLYDELLSIWEQTNKTILLITHDVDEAIFLSDRIIIFTKSPSRVKRVVKIPFARPRRKGIKYSSRFIELKKKIENLIEV